MIPALRRKFVVLATASLAAILAVFCIVVNVGYFVTSTQEADRAIQMIYDGDGFFPTGDHKHDPITGSGFQVTPETQFEVRYFIATLGSSGEAISVNSEHIAELDWNEIVSTARQIEGTGQGSGYEGHYRFAVFDEGDDVQTVVAVNRFRAFQTGLSVLFMTVAGSVACVLVLLVILIPTSKRMVRPFAENFEKQQRFISDASHELKTPLAIISVDTDLIEAEAGESRWTQSMRHQVSRMDTLVKGMLELSRANAPVKEEDALPVAFFEIAERCASDFAPLAEMEGKSLEAQVEPGVFAKGPADDLERVCGILLDNAVKYCDEGGTVRMNLVRQRKTAVLKVSNPCAGLREDDLGHLFDRFYRADESRDRKTGGYGIGLSIAQAIAERHKGRLEVASTNGVVEFTFTVPGAQPGERPATPPVADAWPARRADDALPVAPEGR